MKNPEELKQEMSQMILETMKEMWDKVGDLAQNGLEETGGILVLPKSINLIVETNGTLGEVTADIAIDMGMYKTEKELSNDTNNLEEQNTLSN